jgi:hypothetical protein
MDSPDTHNSQAIKTQKFLLALNRLLYRWLQKD